MGVDVYRFHIKKKITNKVLKEGATRSSNIKKEAKEFFNTIDTNGIVELMREEMSYWKAENGYMYTDDTVMSFLSMYPYLAYRGYITLPTEVIRR